MRRARQLLAIVLALGVAALATAPAGAQTVVGVTATEIKIGNTNPYSGPASAYGTIGKVIGAYFKKVNDEGGVNGRKINYITYDDGYSPPKTVEMVRKLVEQDQVAAALPDPRHAPEQRDPQVHEPAEGAAPLRGHRRHQVERPEELPVDDGLPAQLPDGRARLRGRRAQEPPQREGRDPVPERRLRQGLPEGLRGRARRGRQEDDRAEAELRGDRSHDRLADRESEEQRRHRVLQHHDPEVRGAGHQEGARHRLEARALPEQRVELAGHGAQAGRPRGLEGPHHRALHEGSHRSAVAQRQGLSRTGWPS